MPLLAFPNGQSISEAVQIGSQSIFDVSLSAVRATISSSPDPNPAFDPATLQANDPIVLALRALDPNALTVKVVTPGVPDSFLIPAILSAQKQDIANGGNGDVAVLLDWFGNLIFCLPGQINQSAIKTPWMRVTQEYYRVRHKMIVSGQPNAEKYLLPPKFGLVLFLRAPNDSYRDLIDIGAYGSTMENFVPDQGWPNFQ